MNEWCMVRGRATLHLFRNGRSICGVVSESEVIERNVLTNRTSRCGHCRGGQNGFGSTNGDNEYMRHHFKSMGLSSHFDTQKVRL